MGLEVGIKENVETEKLEAILSGTWIQDLFHSSLELRFDSNEGLYDGVVDPLPDRLHIYAKALQVAL